MRGQGARPAPLRCAAAEAASRRVVEALVFGIDPGVLPPPAATIAMQRETGAIKVAFDFR